MPIKPPRYKVGDIVYCIDTGELGRIRSIIPDDGTWLGREEYWIQNFKGFKEPTFRSRGCPINDIVPIDKEIAKVLVEYKIKENDASDEYRYTCQKLCGKQLSDIKTKENNASKEYRWILNNEIKKHKSDML